MSIIGGLWSIAVLLIGVVWNQLNKRVDMHDKYIGEQYSSLNDLRVDLSSLKTNVNNHADKFDEIHESIVALRDMVVEGLNRINDKLDNWRERRQ